MVLNNYKGGQLANRIVSFAHLIANSIEHNYALVNPEFDEFEPYFTATNSNNFNGYPISINFNNSRIKTQLIRRVARLFTDITHSLFTRTPWYVLYRIFKTYDKQGKAYNLNNAAFVKDAQTRNVLVQGWGFRDAENFDKHAEKLRSFFTPVQQYAQEVKAIITQAKAQADLVYGVHIRRGDYAIHEGGKYFFTDEVYADKMMQLVTQNNAIGKTCAFVICSNEPVVKENYPEELLLITGARHFITDLYCLASCNGIIGPPSTFSGWASFYGKVPIHPILSKDDIIQMGEYIKVV
jgi:hypothetical protein